MKLSTKVKLEFWISFVFGVTFAYFIWLTWNKLTEWIGNSTIAWIITGFIVILGILLGHFSIKGIAKKFAN
jgi:glucan phosphoethanolaminetransferase (alkaline phosphatase superfamily)